MTGPVYIIFLLTELNSCINVIAVWLFITFNMPPLLLIVGAKVVGERCLLFVTGVGQDSDSIVLFLICIEQ